MASRATRKQEIEALLSPAVITALADSVPGFDRAGLLSAIIFSFGGQENLGAAIVSEYHNAPIGGMVRQRILDLICRLISQHSNVERLKPVEEMDTEELHQTILSMVPALERAGVGVTVPAPVATGA